MARTSPHIQSANPADRDRLDQMLVRLGHYESRARARDAISRGAITVDGKLAVKPGALVSPHRSNRHRRSGAGLCLARGPQAQGRA
jgi:hypothetical protein